MEVGMVDKIEKTGEKLSPVMMLAKLDAERSKILESAKADALEKANEAVSELNALGFHYQLTEEVPKANGTKRGEPSGECSICKFATVKPHDPRSHKSQTVKAPFTDEELKQRGLVRAI